MMPSIEIAMRRVSTLRRMFSEAAARDLEAEAGELDALEIALTTAVCNGEVWQCIGESARRDVALYVLGVPARGFVLDQDLGAGMHACRRFDVNGVELAYVQGVRQLRDIPHEVDALHAQIESVLGRNNG
jgi:hypothetical protein